MARRVVVDPLYRSFSREPFANGGCAAGLLAQHLTGPVEVTLRRPIPVETPLDIELDGTVRAGDTVVGSVAQTTVDVEPPEPLSLAEAEEAAKRSPIHTHEHPGPRCFVCGPERQDGLRLFAGPVTGRPLVATPWLTDDRFRPEMVWGALDCPAAITIWQPGLLPLAYRFAVDVRKPVRPGERLAVAAWLLDGEGDRRTTGSALFAEDGDTVAVGRVAWRLLKHP